MFVDEHHAAILSSRIRWTLRNNYPVNTHKSMECKALRFAFVGQTNGTVNCLKHSRNTSIQIPATVQAIRFKTLIWEYKNALLSYISSELQLDVESADAIYLGPIRNALEFDELLSKESPALLP